MINFLAGDYPFDQVFENDVTEELTCKYMNFMQRPGDFLKTSDVELISLIQGMLEYKMDNRFSIDDVLKHPWCQLKQATPLEAR